MGNSKEMLVKYSENFVSIKKLMFLKGRRVMTIFIFVCLSHMLTQRAIGWGN